MTKKHIYSLGGGACVNLDEIAAVVAVEEVVEEASAHFSGGSDDRYGGAHYRLPFNWLSSGADDQSIALPRHLPLQWSLRYRLPEVSRVPISHLVFGRPQRVSRSAREHQAVPLRRACPL